MAARAIVEERRQLAVKRIQEDAAALSEPLGIDATGFLSPFVKGDPAYQEMVRTEELANLLSAVREKVAPAPKKAPAKPASWPQNAAPAPQKGRERADDDEGPFDVNDREDEPQFHGYPLSEFDGKSDEDILAYRGLGQATLAKIRDAQKSARRK